LPDDLVVVDQKHRHVIGHGSGILSTQLPAASRRAALTGKQMRKKLHALPQLA
jgi:hypothetical protein